MSIFNLFKIGIGPSSSHTVGPMLIANTFVKTIKEKQLLNETTRIKIELFGSLGATGIGHQSDIAILLGLLGNVPKDVDINSIKPTIKEIKKTSSINILNEKSIDFSFKKDLILYKNKTLSFHPNGIKLTIYNLNKELFNKTYYSIGGGEIVSEDDIKNGSKKEPLKLPYFFSSAKELLYLCEKNSMPISEIVFENEKVFKTDQKIKEDILEIWRIMKECVQNGLSNHDKILPGGLNVSKRANKLYMKLKNRKDKSPLSSMDWVDLFAIAVNEENASTRRVVTAPTNGAAGIIPAVLHYIIIFLLQDPKKEEKTVIDFLLTAGAIGLLYQKNASISGADVGCQGEVGVACSMAAAGLAQFLGADAKKIENAAEVGMEHNLGLTCDPIGGLVQIPCIERNAMGAIKAINAARIALNEDGRHYVSLDSVIKTMYETGKDMNRKYKETAEGGLAVYYVQC